MDFKEESAKLNVEWDVCIHPHNPRRWHCWHGYGGTLLSDPPIRNEICCYCGETRMVTDHPARSHGEYAP